MKPIGLQLYSLREMAAKDFPGTLRKVAEIGYTGVETAGLHGHKPSEIASLIKDLGMVVCSSHTGLPTRETVQEIVDTEMAMGNARVVSGFGPDELKTADMAKSVAARFNEAAELLKPHGMKFIFHNHWWEFLEADGKYIYDILMAEAPLAMSELDVYWTTYGKADPVEVIKKYKSRIPLLHVKDGNLTPDVMMTAVGSGKLDMPKIIGAADPSVLEWVIVELDNCETDMLQAVADSYAYLTSNGLATGNK